jgi:adhesin transport system outer membrane protein
MVPEVEELGRVIVMRASLGFGIFIAAVVASSSVARSEPFTINDAIRMAVQTHPSVGEAAANRRATEAELHQAQGVLLPQIRLQAQGGPNLSDQKDVIPAPTGNNSWLPGSKASISVHQLLFDGFTSINDIWRQAARVDAAAARVHERGGLTALDAAEAYIDVVRYMRLVALAQENVRAHNKILSNVQQRFKGGRAGEGDLEQTQERVDSAEAALIEFRRSLEDARARFRKTIGVEPYNLRGPGRLRGLPTSKDQVLAVTLTDNPTIKAAQGDADAARYAFHSTAGAFLPTVSLEASATKGNNEDNIVGHYTQESIQAVATWDIFRGGQDSWKRKEMAERYTQATMAHARLQRDAFESVDKAWSARTITVQRIAKLDQQISADRKVISAYSKEYDLGQRSLIDLLNAENQLFNAQVSIESAKGVAIFADYQLLAAMGKLLPYVKAPHPVDAEPLVPSSFGLLPSFPPILLTLPQPGPEPVNVTGTPSSPAVSSERPAVPPRPPAQESFTQRWGAIESNTAMGYAPEVFSSPKSMATLPKWPIVSAQKD